MHQTLLTATLGFDGNLGCLWVPVSDMGPCQASFSEPLLMLTCSDLRLWGRDAWEVLTSGHRALHSKCRQQKPCCPAQEETRVEKIVTLVRNPYSCLSSILGGTWLGPPGDAEAPRSWWLLLRLPQGSSEATFPSVDQVWNLQPV